MDLSSENCEISSDGNLHISNITAMRVQNPDAGVLRSIANSIEPAFPDAADILRGLANKYE